MSHVAKLSGANNTPKNEKTLTGKTVLVTGSTRGIGLAVAKEMLARGANVMFHGTPKPDGKPSEEFREEFEALQAQYPLQKLAYRQCDIGDYDQVHTLMEETAKFGGGRIDVLVNNAGVQRQFSIDNLSIEDFDTVQKTNLYGPFYATKAALPFMRRGKSDGIAQIINMSSVHGLVPSPERAAYCMAKHGVEALEGVSAAEYAKYNIRVNNVNPAFVVSDLAMGPVKNKAAEFEKTGMSATDAMAAAENWRLKNQGGTWLEMKAVVDATVDLADFTDKRGTGESVVLDKGKDAPAGIKGYVATAREAGAAYFEEADRQARRSLNERIAALGAARSA